MACFVERTGFTGAPVDRRYWRAETVETRYEDRSLYARLQNGHEAYQRSIGDRTAESLADAVDQLLRHIRS